MPADNQLQAGRYFDVSTDRVAAGDRWEFWRDTVLDRSDADLRTDPSRGFSARITGYIGDRAELRDGRSDAVVLRRRAARCRQDGGDEILLSAIVTTAGLVRYRNNSVAFAVPAGRFLINDLAVPFEIEMARYRSINFRLSRTAVASATGGWPRALSGGVLPDSPLASLLFSQLVRLADALPDLDDSGRIVALNATADFALATLRLQARAEPWDDDSHWSGMWQAAQRHIERNLDRAELNPETLARALRCSRTQLYRLFARHDVGVMDHIRDARLARCREMLADPACRLPVAEIASLCGMDNPSAFSRAFRRRFGHAPGELRRDART